MGGGESRWTTYRTEWKAQLAQEFISTKTMLNSVLEHIYQVNEWTDAYFKNYYPAFDNGQEFREQAQKAETKMMLVTRAEVLEQSCNLAKSFTKNIEKYTYILPCDAFSSSSFSDCTTTLTNVSLLHWNGNEYNKEPYCPSSFEVTDSKRWFLNFYLGSGITQKPSFNTVF